MSTLLAPSTVLYVPATHSWHCDLAVAPVADSHVPAGHDSHSCSPRAEPNVPGAQSMHAVSSWPPVVFR